MKYMNMIFCLSILTAFGIAHAHEGHDHDEKPVTQQEAANTADKALAALVKNKEVEADWQAKHRQGTTTQRIGDAQVWVASYKKPSGNDTLYIFIDVLGNYIEANRTGKL